MSDSEARAERFEELFAATSRPLLGYALRRSPSPAVAADVVAETMLIAWRRIDDIPAGDEARLWLYGVARRVLANQRRSERRGHRLNARLAEVVGRAALEPSADTVVNGIVVAQAIAQLDETDRELLRLTSWEQLSPGEIAVVLGVPPGTVRSRLHRARSALREVLRLDGFDERSSANGHVDVGGTVLAHPNQESSS